DPVGTQAPRPCESRARLIEAAGAQRRETLAGRPGVTVIAQGGARPGEPHAGLRILRVECEHLGVVLRRARVLSRGLRILGVREQRQNARQTSGAALPERRALVLRIDARRPIEGLGGRPARGGPAAHARTWARAAPAAGWPTAATPPTAPVRRPRRAPGRPRADSATRTAAPAAADPADPSGWRAAPRAAAQRSRSRT